MATGITPSSHSLNRLIHSGSEANAANYKNIGMNMFTGLYNGPTDSSLAALRQNGLGVAVQQQTATAVASNTVTMWTQQDEPDNAQPDGHGGYLPCVVPSTIVSDYNALKAGDPQHRPVFLDFGRGAADVNWGGRGTCTGNTAMYGQYAQGADVLSFNVYPVNQGLTLDYVGKGVDNLKSWGEGKPVWADIETTNYGGTTGPTPAQTKAEAWLAIVHGAKGIMYFCHIFTPSFIEAGLLSDSNMSAAVRTNNAQISSLAPVISLDHSR